ncbi:hypothetical protein [Ectothiorhodospira lacustris]|uniref:hypothetical protein n=1 Tax=Ectothiorhodospira lacustris TaxID=2899127 RepID=UPI001EE8FF01|nr:hypothetical protein [Ectothiorhodospira lacustris]MCG5500372.1 hypothetical protein [Ectothiorhodospira lacustris]MCG5509850.1 hypothetical protein [Ectothiorhodospira lacustris]MCG5521103.1 hypothetical protein [Ectothiorhodospira lacustris]
MNKLIEWGRALRRLPVLNHPMFSFDNAAMTFIVVLVVVSWLSFLSVIVFGR